VSAALYPDEESCNSFQLSLSRPEGHSAAGRITSIDKSNYIIGNRTHNLLAAMGIFLYARGMRLAYILAVCSFFWCFVLPSGVTTHHQRKTNTPTEYIYMHATK
jgi:hypothetical protein